MTQIKDQVAFVTGAASGIGRALALELANRGAKAVVISDVNEDELEKTAQMVRSRQVNVIARKVDVANREEVEALVDETVRTQGSIDLIFNNAGVALGASTNEMSYENLEWLMGINFWGVVHGTKAALPHMLEKDHGHIVNVSSIFGFIGVPTQSAYCASKFAVRGFNESLVHEMAGKNVNVTTVHPGGIKTNIARNARMEESAARAAQGSDPGEEFEKIARTTPAEAANVILNGVEKNKKRVMIGADAHIITRMVRFFPNLYFFLLGKMGKRAGAEAA